VAASSCILLVRPPLIGRVRPQVWTYLEHTKRFTPCRLSDVPICVGRSGIRGAFRPGRGREGSCVIFRTGQLPCLTARRRRLTSGRL